MTNPNQFSDLFSAIAAGAVPTPKAPAAPVAKVAPVRVSDIAMAGTAAEGSGAITGWGGLGSLTRTQIIEALSGAGLPVEWAPKVKSAVGYAGGVVSNLNSRGYISRRARRAAWEKVSNGVTEVQHRAYRARWTVAANAASTANVGDALGNVVLTVELHDGSDELHTKGDADLAAYVIEQYNGKRDAEVFQAGDVTAWLSSTLIRECAAARFGIGYYIPAETRDIAGRLVGAISALWGRSWIAPLLPVATSDELRQGIARGFTDEIAAVERKLTTEREAARAAAAEKGEEGGEISPATAARLLRDLADVDGRADAYRVLCGADALAPAVAKLRKLTETLSKLADDASMRFSMLELDPSNHEVVEEAPSLAERAADAAPKAAERAPVAAAETVATAPAPKVETITDVSALRAQYKALQEASGMLSGDFRTACVQALEVPVDAATAKDWVAAAKVVTAPAPAPAPVVAPEPPAVSESAAERFSMLELD